MARKAAELGHRVPRAHRPLAAADGRARARRPSGCEAQLEVVARLNEELAPFRILTGIEVDILDDGRLDQERRPARRARRRGRERALEAAHAAAADDRPHGRGDGEPAHRHPRPLHRPARGRARAGRSRRSTPTSCSARARTSTRRSRSTAGPSGSTRRCACSRQVVAAGCKVSIDSDAHAVGQLEWQPYGCARAAEAGVPETASSTPGRSSGCSPGRPRTREFHHAGSGERAGPVRYQWRMTPPRRHPLARGARPRPARRLRLRGQHDPRVLPAVVPEPPAAARPRAFFAGAPTPSATGFARAGVAVPTVRRDRASSASKRRAGCWPTAIPSARRARGRGRHGGRHVAGATSGGCSASRRSSTPTRCASSGCATSCATGRDVTGALYDAGYGSSSRLYEQSDARLGMTPASYGAGGAGRRPSCSRPARRRRALVVATTPPGPGRARRRRRRARAGGDRLPRDDATSHRRVRLDGPLPPPELPVDVARVRQHRVNHRRARPAGTGGRPRVGPGRAGSAGRRRTVARSCTPSPGRHRDRRAHRGSPGLGG